MEIITLESPVKQEEYWWRKSTCFGGYDVGKRGNPSHCSIFAIEIRGEQPVDSITMIHQKFLDSWDYTRQVAYLAAAIDYFNIQRLYYDATRGELEERSLPRACVPIILSNRTGPRAKGKVELATNFAKMVEQKRIKLLNDDRFISQITCVSGDLEAPDTPKGHGDCYDKETEVLTDKGWKLFKDLDHTENIATLNADGFMEWQKPTDYIEKYYIGKMYFVDSTQINLKVTPKHKLYIGNAMYQNYKLRFPQERFNMQSCYKKDAKWIGEEREFFILPAYSGSKKKKELIKIPMDTWLEFLGYYIAEGHTTARERNRYQSCISQNNGFKRDKIRECINKIPIKYRENEDGFWFNNCQFGKYLVVLGKSPDKFIPEEFMKLSSRQLHILFEALMLGDGTYGPSFRNYYTSSNKLANQLQELLLKIGKSGNIYKKDYIGRKAPHGTTKLLHYQVSVIEKRNKPMINKDKISDSWVDYDDKIYCVTVPNHVIYVRRKGKPCWSGNSFISVMLAIGVYFDYYATDRKMGTATICNAQDIVRYSDGNVKSPNNNVGYKKSLDNTKCKICGGVNFDSVPNGNQKICKKCFTLW